MPFRRVLIGLIAAASFAGTILVGQPAFAAPDWEYNVASSGSTQVCGEMTGVIDIYGGCGTFIPDGDYFWIRDDLADGHSAVVRWENYDSSVLVRRGVCGQTVGVGYAGYCNKNVAEGTQIKYQVCTMEWGTKAPVDCSTWYWRAS